MRRGDKRVNVRVIGPPAARVVHKSGAMMDDF